MCYTYDFYKCCIFSDVLKLNLVNCIIIFNVECDTNHIVFNKHFTYEIGIVYCDLTTPRMTHSSAWARFIISKFCWSTTCLETYFVCLTSTLQTLFEKYISTITMHKLENETLIKVEEDLKCCLYIYYTYNSQVRVKVSLFNL